MNEEINRAAGAELTFFIPNTESIGQLKEMNPNFSLNIKYKSADDWAKIQGKPLRAFYMGMKEVPNDKGEAINCAGFVTEEEVFISGQMILVEAVRHLDVNTPVEITYRGKKPNKSSDGSTMLFDIATLK